MNTNERRIIARAVELLAKAGFRCTHHTATCDGDAEPIEQHTPGAIAETAGQVDDCALYFTSTDAATRAQWARFIFGNGNYGRDVICDNSSNPEFDAVIERVQRYAETLPESNR